jgi:hypothetical protein
MPGGVCAVLDYEVDLMAEYVAEMATRVVTPEATVTAPFRKFVSQILTSTRLPSTTILLGMNYLAKRINTLKVQGPFKATEGQVWRYLTVALLLGSKFLDDNTFQNRSWSEVSGIAVSELNTLENAWLRATNWGLYVNLDHSNDYTAWLDSWREWQAMKKRAAAQANRERLAALVPAIDTELARFGGNNWVQQQTAEYERYQKIKRSEVSQSQNYRSREATWNHSSWQQAPLTPPDSGYGTPEYINSATSVNSRYNDWFSQAASRIQYNGSNRYQQPPHHNSFYQSHHPNYPPHYQYGGGVWDHNIAECNCPSCLGPTAKQQPYFMAHGFGQPVMG